MPTIQSNQFNTSRTTPKYGFHSTIWSNCYPATSLVPYPKEGFKHIFIIEDIATRWVELFALTESTAENCAITLINEVFFRFGIPRRIISDNGTQFVSAVMQQVTFCLDIRQTLKPVYHPEAKPEERKNRDLKPQLAICVKNYHIVQQRKQRRVKAPDLRQHI